MTTAPNQQPIFQLKIGESVRFILRQDGKETHLFSGTLFSVGGWNEDGTPLPDMMDEVGQIFLKWDGCGHVGLRDPELSKEWVHICGADDMERHLTALRWMWLTAKAQITSYSEKEGGTIAPIPENA